MSSYSSSIVLKKIVSHQVWQQLAELWLTMSTNDETQLFTNDTISKLLENEHNIHNSQQLEIDKFFRLITPKFNAFLRQEKSVITQKYLVSVIFDREAIIQELLQLGSPIEKNQVVINRLRKKFTAKLTENSHSSAEFVVNAMKLLITYCRAC